MLVHITLCQSGGMRRNYSVHCAHNLKKKKKKAILVRFISKMVRINMVVYGKSCIKLRITSKC